MEISFDEEKRQLTLLKRGLDFARASEVFDGTEYTWVDDRFDYGEVRFNSFGLLDKRLEKPMTESKQGIDESWVDPDDVPEWTEDHFRYAQLSVGGKVVREARGTWTHPGPGRPLSANPQKQVTLRLDPEVIEKFRATGKGWQSRINAELRKALGI